MKADLSTLVSNLKIIKNRYPGIHYRLNKNVVGTVLDGLYSCEDGRYAYFVEDEKKHRILLKESSKKIDTSGKQLVILLGIGLGYQLMEIFENLSSGQILVAVETRPELLCKSLYVHDWQHILNSERFRLFLGYDRSGLDDLARLINHAPGRDDLVLLDNKVLVTIDRKLYSWWNLYFYLVSGLSYDGIRVINAVMGNFNLWDPENLFLNMPSEFIGQRIDELDPEEVYTRFNLLARVLAPGMTRMRLDELPHTKVPDSSSVLDRVSIIVLCWNKVELTRRCLKSLLGKTEYPDFKVIAVDNGSTDRTRELLLELAAADRRLEPVFLDSNAGIPGGRQAGLDVADGEFILFLDNDTEVERGDFLKIMVNTVKSHPNIGSTGAFPIVYTNDNDDRFIQCVNVPGLAVPVAWCSGYCLMVRQRALEEIGGIDADEFEAYGAEDVYLGYKLRRSGWITVSTPELVGVTHHIAHRLNHYDYNWESSGSKNSEFFYRTFGPRRRLTDAAVDNRIAEGLWERKKQRCI